MLLPVQEVEVVIGSTVPSRTVGLTRVCHATTRVSPAGKLSTGIPVGEKVMAVVSDRVAENETL